MKITPAKVEAAARSFVGADYQHQGRNPRAMDCVGLLVLMAKALKYPHEDLRSYSRRPTDDTLLVVCRKYADEVATSEIRPGDVGIFWFDRVSRVPQHAAIVVSRRDGEGLVHCWEDIGKVVEHAFDKSWRRRLLHAFRLRGIQSPP